MNTLSQLHEDIETRVKAIRDSQSDWLCRQGCDGCCRRLAEVPKITAKEWDLLQEGLAALPPEQLMEISQKVAELAGQVSRPIVCPLLNRVNGECLVYAQRPVACRTYGFYVQRDLGLYCKDIESHVTDGALADLVWGNHDIINRCLCDLGETHDLPVCLTRMILPFVKHIYGSILSQRINAVHEIQSISVWSFRVKTLRIYP